MGLLWSGIELGLSPHTGHQVDKESQLLLPGPREEERQLSRPNGMLESPAAAAAAAAAKSLQSWGVAGGGASRVFQSLQVMAHTQRTRAAPVSRRRSGSWGQQCPWPLSP